MIWSLNVLNAVRGLQVSKSISDRMLISVYNPDELVKTTCKELLFTITEAGLTCAVELNPFDLTIERVHDPETLANRFLCHWQPTTEKTEIRGGAIDGQVVTVHALDSKLVIPLNGAQLDVGQKMQWPPDPVLIEVYELAGWDEEKRHWVFDLVPTKLEKS